MPYNGSGSFSAPSASFPAVSGALIESAKFNNVVNDIASGLSTAITKDGQTTVAANLPMAGFRHTGVGDAVARTDYASAKQVQDSAMLWAGTAGGTADAITLSLTPPITAYAAGQSFVYKSGASANTGAMTVNINSLGNKAIQNNGAALVAGNHAASRWFRITYDGAAFQVEPISLSVEYGATVYASAASNQAVVSGAWTKVTLGTEGFDTASAFASSTFTVPIDGYYNVFGLVRGYSATLTSVTSAVYKNGTVFQRGANPQFASGANASLQSPIALPMRLLAGDTIELWGNVIGGSPTFDSTSADATSYFGVSFLRPL